MSRRHDETLDEPGDADRGIRRLYGIPCYRLDGIAGETFVKAMSAEEFVALARSVLAREGKASFEDDTLLIRSDYNGLDLEVTRKAMPHVAPHLTGTNPTTMVKNGAIIRHHGEATYLDGHLRKLASGAVAERTAESISEDELREAVIATIGQSTFDVLEPSMGFVAAHERACRVAFLENERSERSEVLRSAMRHLDRRGIYAFYEAAGPKP